MPLLPEQLLAHCCCHLLCYCPLLYFPWRILVNRIHTESKLPSSQKNDREFESLKDLYSEHSSMFYGVGNLNNLSSPQYLHSQNRLSGNDFPVLLPVFKGRTLARVRPPEHFQASPQCSLFLFMHFCSHYILKSSTISFDWRSQDVE